MKSEQHAAEIKIHAEEVFSLRAFRAIHSAGKQEQRADAHSQDSDSENHVRRADDLDVESKGVVPPSAEGARGDHPYPPPASHERAERAAESPHFYGSRLRGGIVSKGSGKNQIDADEAHQDSAELNGEVRGSPESVATDAHVPGDVPVEAEDDGRDAHEAAPDVPGGRWGMGAGDGGVGNRSASGHRVLPPTSSIKGKFRASNTGSVRLFKSCAANL